MRKKSCGYWTHGGEVRIRAGLEITECMQKWAKGDQSSFTYACQKGLQQDIFLFLTHREQILDATISDYQLKHTTQTKSQNKIYKNLTRNFSNKHNYLKSDHYMHII